MIGKDYAVSQAQNSLSQIFHLKSRYSELGRTIKMITTLSHMVSKAVTSPYSELLSSRLSQNMNIIV